MDPSWDVNGRAFFGNFSPRSIHGLGCPTGLAAFGWKIQVVFFQPGKGTNSVSYRYLEPVCPLFWGLNHPKEGPFHSKQVSFGFQLFVGIIVLGINRIYLYYWWLRNVFWVNSWVLQVQLLLLQEPYSWVRNAYPIGSMSGIFYLHWSHKHQLFM